jgi:hypothetical protein
MGKAGRRNRKGERQSQPTFNSQHQTTNTQQPGINNNPPTAIPDHQQSALNNLHSTTKNKQLVTIADRNKRQTKKTADNRYG